MLTYDRQMKSSSDLLHIDNITVPLGKTHVVFAWNDRSLQHVVFFFAKNLLHYVLNDYETF